ncbi:MAG: FkbM family methyltransferase [Tagaea sp.]
MTPSFRVERDGVAFRVAPDPDDAQERAFWKSYAEGWERDTLAAIAGLLPQGGVHLDIGAWIGPTLLFAAARAGEAHGFEPDPAAYAKLARNVALNPDLAARVRIRPAAIWTRDATLPLAVAGPGDSTTSAVLRPGEAAALEAQALDARGPEIAPLLARADFVKIDVEGGEFDLIPYIAPLLAERLPALHLSFHAHRLDKSDRAAWRDKQRACVAALDFYPLVLAWNKDRWHDISARRDAAYDDALARHGLEGALLYVGTSV